MSDVGEGGAPIRIETEERYTIVVLVIPPGGAFTFGPGALYGTSAWPRAAWEGNPDQESFLAEAIGAAATRMIEGCPEEIISRRRPAKPKPKPKRRAPKPVSDA